MRRVAVSFALLQDIALRLMRSDHRIDKDTWSAHDYSLPPEYKLQINSGVLQEGKANVYKVVLKGVVK